MYQIIDGKALADKMRQELKEKIEKGGYKIGLAVILVGENPASQVYVRNKILACEKVGIISHTYRLDENITQEKLEELVVALGEDNNVNGILVQLPLPKHLDSERVLKLIPDSKDVDGFGANNIGKLALNMPESIPCTPYGVMEMLKSVGIEVAGKTAVVVGRSNIVGKPMGMLLTNANATVTICHSKTKNLKEVCSTADILVVAIGKAKFVTEDMVKEGAVVIDVGMDRDENGKLCGDVDFENVKSKCSYISPVPGGVGPMTVTMLMYNTYNAYLRSNNV